MAKIHGRAPYTRMVGHNSTPLPPILQLHIQAIIDRVVTDARYLSRRISAALPSLTAPPPHPKNNFILVQTQGTLAATDWANELHPGPAGFQKLAQVFVTALRAQFPGRI